MESPKFVFTHDEGFVPAFKKAGSSLGNLESLIKWGLYKRLNVVRYSFSAAFSPILDGPTFLTCLFNDPKVLSTLLAVDRDGTECISLAPTDPSERNYPSSKRLVSCKP
ncbi:protein of unknown function DUF4498, partial [Kipferlia bialata]|eukprot:g7326.t1